MELETMKTTIRYTLIAIALLPAGLTLTPLTAPAAENPAEQDARMEWFREAKFGMFVHWGIYSVVGGEYKGQKLPNSAEWMMCRGKIPIAEYAKYADQFNPTKFDAQEFVRRARDAGMKYLVITAKHHDGFSMFDSKANDFNVVKATPFKRDIMRELAEACQDQGLKFGFYYSQAQDWNHPGGFGNNWDKTLKRVSSDDYVREKAVPEVKQLLTEYGPIGIFWWDTPRDMSPEAFESLYSLTTLQPETLTNDRLGEDYPGDYKTFERKIPSQPPAGVDWEVCMPISGSWGYKKGDNDFKSSSTLIRNLADIAGKGGNYLLNVSPTGEGTLLPQAMERLKAVGRWMNTNGESIYGTTGSPLPQLDWGRCTQKPGQDGTTLYLHVFDWPKDGQLLVPGLKNPVNKARLLDGGSALETRPHDEGTLVVLPGKAPDEVNSVVVLEVGGVLKIEDPGPSQNRDGSVTLTAAMAYLHNNEGRTQIRLQKREDYDNLGYWTDQEASAEWSFRISKPGTFDIVADLATEKESSRFTLQVAGEKLAAKASSTGSYYDYERQNLGTVRIDQAGQHILRIKPDSEHWQPINVKQVELTSRP